MLLGKNLQNYNFWKLLSLISCISLAPFTSYAQTQIEVETNLTNYVDGVEPVNIRTGGFLNESQILELAESGLPLNVRSPTNSTAIDLLIETCGDLDTNADYFAEEVIKYNFLSTIEDDVIAGQTILIPFCPYRKFDEVEIDNGDTLSKIYIDYYSENLPKDYSNRTAKRSLINYNLDSIALIAEINGFESPSDIAQPNYPLKIGEKIKLPVYSPTDRWFISTDVTSYDFLRDFDKVVLRGDNSVEELSEINRLSYLDPEDFVISKDDSEEIAWVPNDRYFGLLSSQKQIEDNNVVENTAYVELLEAQKNNIEKLKSEISNLRNQSRQIELQAKRSRKLKSFGLLRDSGGFVERAKIRSLHAQISTLENELKTTRENFEILDQNNSYESQTIKIKVIKDDTPIGLSRLCNSTVLEMPCSPGTFSKPIAGEVLEFESKSISAIDLDEAKTLGMKKATIRVASKITSERGDERHISSLTIEAVESEKAATVLDKNVEKGVFEHLSNVNDNEECNGHENFTIPNLGNFLKLFSKQQEFANAKYGGPLKATTVGLIDTGIGKPKPGEVWNIHNNEILSNSVLSRNDSQANSMSQDFDNSIPGDVYGISLSGCEENCSADEKHKKYGHLGYHKTQYFKDRFKHGTNVASIMLGGKEFVQNLGHTPIQLTSVNVTNRRNPTFVGSKGVVEGIEYFTNSARGRTPQPLIINISYKTKDTSEKFETPAFFPENHLFVVAAGQNPNSTGSDIDDSHEEVWPANMGGKSGLHNVLTVGASKTIGNVDIPSWANYGEDKVDLFATGCNLQVYSPSYSLQGRTYAAKYEVASGSSMAAPQVTFGASIISYLSDNRLKPRRIKNRILSSVDVHDAYSNKSSTGGQFNVNKSINIYSDMVVKNDGTAVLGIVDDSSYSKFTSKCVPDKRTRLEVSRLKKILIGSSEISFWRSTLDHEYNYKPIVCNYTSLSSKIKILDDETNTQLEIPLKNIREIIPREINRI